MDISTAFDIIFLLAAVYFLPQLGGTRIDAASATASSNSRSNSHTPLTASFSSPSLTPAIVLHPADDYKILSTKEKQGTNLQFQASTSKPTMHKRKAVSFSITSMEDMTDRHHSGLAPTPLGHHRPPTPYMRAPPTPSEILALGAEAELDSLPPINSPAHNGLHHIS